MSAEIPPAGAERDAEIARLLNNVQYFSGPMGWFYVYPEDCGGYRSANHFGRPSTDPAACDRLVEEMVRRGFDLVHRADKQGHGARFMVADVASDDGLAFYEGRGATRMEAVSAAALLALRGAR